MTKKDYELIAASIKSTLGTWSPDTKERQSCIYAIEDTAKSLADALAQDNPRFDKLRFLTACGMGTVHKLSNGAELHDPYNIVG